MGQIVPFMNILAHSWPGEVALHCCPCQLEAPEAWYQCQTQCTPGSNLQARSGKICQPRANVRRLTWAIPSKGIAALPNNNTICPHGLIFPEDEVGNGWVN